eukprot:5227851-Amphidinium_carterae.1
MCNSWRRTRPPQRPTKGDARKAVQWNLVHDWKANTGSRYGMIYPVSKKPKKTRGLDRTTFSLKRSL